jgi:hypothetical protein
MKPKSLSQKKRLEAQLYAAEKLKNMTNEDASALTKVLSKDEIEKIANIPSDEEIKNSPNPKYASAYYQGKFDLMMDIIDHIEKGE